MPIRVPENLPAVELLKEENIFIIGDKRAEAQDIRHLRIGIVNLMPLKIRTETDFLRVLSNSPLQIEVDFVEMSSHSSKNTPVEHLNMFYRKFSEIKHKNYDGLIITGAPVEHLDFEEVDFWDELTEIMDWSRTHVTSTMFICWAAFAGMYHFYGIPKRDTPTKLSGVYAHEVLKPHCPLLRGFDDLFYVPHSRFTGIREDDLAGCPDLTVVTRSRAAGPHIIIGRDGREIFITGHSEYAPDTLKMEYERDLGRGLTPSAPENYFKDDDLDSRVPVVSWRAHANLLFSNWHNYYVYQITPYDISRIND